MRRLMLLRHAQAVPHATAEDHARKLTEQGRREAHLLRDYFSQENILVDQILSSDSTRTRETVEHILPSYLKTVPTIYDSHLYNALPQELSTQIQKMAPTIRAALLVGHNPHIATFARSLVGYGDRYAAARLQESFPTCSVAIIDFDTENWSEELAHSGKLSAFLTPAGLLKG